MTTLASDPGRPEVLVAHAYVQSNDAHPLAFMCPLPPLQPACVAAWLDQETDTKIAMWDATFRVGADSFAIAVSRIGPKLVWLYTHPTTRSTAAQMIAAARGSGAVVIAGGPDAGLKPAFYLRAGAHAVVPGEGEDATLALLLALRSEHYRASDELLRRIPGLYYLDEYGTVRPSDGKERIVETERLPEPLRDPVETRIHLERWAHLGRPRSLSLISARGCPVSCGYCTHSVFGRPYRRRSPEAVVDEMERLAYSFEVDRLIFDDETFLVDPHWLTEFAATMRKRGLQIPFEGSAHPALVDPEVMAPLVEAGLTHIDLHAASGSSDLLRRLNWSYAPSAIYRSANVIRDASVSLGLQVFVGLPGETRRDLDASMEMVRLIRANGVQVTRVDPDSPALFRKDWERVVAGPFAEVAGSGDRPPSAVLDAAVTWMRSVGSSPEGAPADPIRDWIGPLRRPILRALVRGLPGLGRR
ncbi:MAG: radical SAM protein [Myxococcota bacterium]|nr:radical SAM protein [Myxococcota bacterium]